MKIVISMALLLAFALILTPDTDAAGRSFGYGCGTCYTPSYQPTYYAPTYYQERELVYVNSVQLFMPFEFRYTPPTAILQLYGVPQISSVTTTTTTTSAVSNGATQQIAVGGAGAPVLTTGGVTTVTPGQPQSIDDGLPVVQPGARAPVMGTGVASVLKQFCSSCHQGANVSGGVTLLDSSGRVDLKRQSGALTLYDVLMAMDGIPSAMPPASKNDPSKRVPVAQRKVLWEELRKGGK